MSRCSTGTSSRATTSTACSTSTRPTSGCSSRSRSRRAWCCRSASTASRASGATCFTTATKRRLSGSINLMFGDYWSGNAEQVIDVAHVQDAAARSTFSLHTNQTFARLPEGHFIARIFTVEHQRRRLAAPVVLEPGAVRQPVAQSRLAEPHALDAAARQRCVLRLQSGLDREEAQRRQPALQDRRHEALGEGAVRFGSGGAAPSPGLSMWRSTRLWMQLMTKVGPVELAQ